MESLFALDGAALLWIQENLRTDWLTPVMLLITKLGNTGFIWIVLSLVMLCFRKTRLAGLAGIGSLLCSLLFTNIILKELVARPRPYTVLENLVSLIGTAGGYSFPSGHTSSSFACASAVCFMLKKTDLKWSWLLLVFAAVMGFTRLYVGVHYPTDILGGAVLGVFYGYAGFQGALFVEWLWMKLMKVNAGKR